MYLALNKENTIKTIINATHTVKFKAESSSRLHPMKEYLSFFLIFLLHLSVPSIRSLLKLGDAVKVAVVV